MSESYGALATDFYVNQRLNVKLDLPTGRETILGLFDRVRKDFGHMTRFRRLSGELALESEGPDEKKGLPHQWVALRRTSVRSGCVNPPSPREAYRLHRMLLEASPYFLSISPLDIDYVELLYGFDLVCTGNHDAIVFDALYGGGGKNAPALTALGDVRGAIPIECQPLLGFALSDSCDLQAQFEVKTRTPTRAVRSGEFDPAPISVYLTVRQYTTLRDVGELKGVLGTLSSRAESLLESIVIPRMLMPLREAIASTGSA